MADAIPVPGGPDEITPAWLTDVLRESGQLPRGRVSALVAETIGADRGFTGVIARLRPDYRGLGPGEAPPAWLVAKLPTAKREVASAYRATHSHDAAISRRFYQRCTREVAFYRDLAMVGDATPQLYYAATDPDRQRIVLLLEDLAGARAGDGLAGCTPTEARAIIEAVAPLHARMWQRRVPGWIPPLVTDPQANQDRYASWVGPFLDRYGDQLPAPVRRLVAQLRTGYGAVLAELRRSPTTVIHGDLHLDNVLFDPPDARRRAVLLDWQGVSCGPAAIDVAEVVFGSLPVDDRRAAEGDLRQRYIGLLAGHGVDDYPVERLHRDLRLALLCQVAGRVGWLATAEPDQLSGREQALVAAAFGDGRLAAALDDHHLLEPSIETGRG